MRQTRFHAFHSSDPWRGSGSRFVATSPGRPRRYQPVALYSGWPNQKGCTICGRGTSRGIRLRARSCISGFSIAIRSIGARQQATKRSTPASNSAFMLSQERPSGSFLGGVISPGPDSHRRPERHSRVQGGCATISRSQPSCSISRTSPTICRLLPSSAGSRSQDHASWPSASKARRTMPEYSQAIRTRTPYSAASRAGTSARSASIRSNKEGIATRSSAAAQWKAPSMK